MGTKRRRVADSDDIDDGKTASKTTRTAGRANPKEETQDVETPSKRRSTRFSRSNSVDAANCTSSKEPSGRKLRDVKTQAAEEGSDDDSNHTTPVKTPKGRPTSQYKLNGAVAVDTPPGKRMLSTPHKENRPGTTNSTPTIVPNADRSARRKSNRTLMRTLLENGSENGEDEGDIAQQIYGSEEDQGEDELATETVDVMEGIKTSKRGRPPGKITKARKRTPSPDILQDLPPHEAYFFQNRPNKVKTSNANLSTVALLDHEEYFTLLRDYKDPHAENIEFLQNLHAKSFNQWSFELRQNFSICLYGWGSKKPLLNRFADFIYSTNPDPSTNNIVIVNGYVQTLTIKDILNTLASAVSSQTIKLGSQPAAMLENLFALLEEDTSVRITLIIHSLDRPVLRRLTTQSILAQVSAHPQVHLIASADHPNFPLLWDSSLRSTFNFLFHDCTTFEPYTVETDVVDEVHELLGRSGRRVGGKEGVSFVLRSLNENSRNLFRVLVAEVLAGMEETGDLEGVEEGFGTKAKSKERVEGAGVEYRVLYHKAVEEFICSNEMNFRTLLKEFHDHQMIQSRKDALGTEFLSVPFRKEELETILEDMTA